MDTGVPNQVDTGLAAKGATQTTALELALDWNEVLTTPVGDGVRLIAMQPGQAQTVFNGGANTLKVYPPSGAKIDALATDAAYSLAAGKTQIYCCYSTTQIRSVQLG